MSIFDSIFDVFRPNPVYGSGLRIFQFKHHDVITPYDGARASYKFSTLVEKVLIAIFFTGLSYCCIHKLLVGALVFIGLILILGLIVFSSIGSNTRFVFDYVAKFYYKAEELDVSEINPHRGGSFDEIESLVLRRKVYDIGRRSYELLLNRHDGVQVEVMHHSQLHDDLYNDVMLLSDRLGLPIINGKGNPIYSNKDSGSTDDLKQYIPQNLLNTRESWSAKIIGVLASVLIAVNIYSIWLNLSDNNPPHITESFSQAELTEWFADYYQTEQGKTAYPNNLSYVEKIVAAPSGDQDMELHVRYRYMLVGKNGRTASRSNRVYQVSVNQQGKEKPVFAVDKVGDKGSANFLLAYLKTLYEKWV